MRSIRKIIIHCTATPAGQDCTVRQITQWHMKRGFHTIGYHYVIGLDGTVHRGRPLQQIGAHCLGLNLYSIGIAYVGGLDAQGRPADTRTHAQIVGLIALVKKLKAKFPKATIHGHNEFAPKDCPCFSVKDELKYYEQ